MLFQTNCLSFCLFACLFVYPWLSRRPHLVSVTLRVCLPHPNPANAFFYLSLPLSPSLWIDCRVPQIQPQNSPPSDLPVVGKSSSPIHVPITAHFADARERRKLQFIINGIVGRSLRTLHESVEGDRCILGNYRSRFGVEIKAPTPPISQPPTMAGRTTHRTSLANGRRYDRSCADCRN